MKSFLFILLVLSLGCSKENSFNDIESLGTADEYATLKEYIQDIQQRFDKFEAGVNVSDFEYKISGDLSVDGGSTVGVCFKGSGITVNKSLFKEGFAKGSVRYNWRLWTTLLHEIGHCFFQLEHYSNKVSVLKGKVFVYYEYTFLEGEEYSFYARDVASFIDTSIMTEQEVYSDQPDYNSEKKNLTG